MAATKVIKPKPVEAARKSPERSRPVPERSRPVPGRLRGADAELKVPAVRKNRASSCPRCPRRPEAQRAPLTTSRERRTRSSSTANWPTTTPDYRRATGSLRPAACPGGPGEQRGVRAETKHAGQSHKAFTVIPPNPKKRRDMQRKAEAELAALEELRLSRAMAYVSINPSSVGGCMSLEEVRLKQQQEMMQAKRKQKPMKTQVMEQTPVLRS